MSLTKTNILVLEDDTALCDLFEYIVDSSELEIFKAHNAKDAQKILENNHIEFGFFDYHFPGSEEFYSTDSSLFLQKYIKENNFSFIVITGDFHLEKKKVKAFGAKDVIYKPFTGEEITELINSLHRADKSIAA